MPIINIMSVKEISKQSLHKLREQVASDLKIPQRSVWIVNSVYEANKMLTTEKQNPIVSFDCRTVYSESSVDQAVQNLRAIVAADLEIAKEDVFCKVTRLPDQQVYSSVKPAAQISLTAIGVVENSRKTPEDDNWNQVQSVIRLDSKTLDAEATEGLQSFSHIEVVFFMNQVEASKIVTGARHPRNNPDWPKVGILSQRGKNRPNQIGVSVCEILKVDGLNILVRGLDAINGSPVLDVKPFMTGFFPKSKITEPDWSVEIMKNYY